MCASFRCRYCSLETPSLALGLLKTYLTAAAINSEVVHANILFADEIGLDVYKTIEGTPTESLVGEWTFASAAFPGAADTSVSFLALVSERVNDGTFELLRRLHPNFDTAMMLRNVRQATPAFVDRVAHRILARQPRIVGCTSTFQQHCASLALLRRIKELDPAVVTMIGGANCEGVMGETAHREFPWLDFVMSGEVDDFFGAFCAARAARGAPPCARFPTGCSGAAAARGWAPGADGAARRGDRRLDQTAVPDYGDYFAALRQTPLGPHIRPALPFESSRGCWWGAKHHCTFCGLNGAGMSFRSKSPRRVLARGAAARRTGTACGASRRRQHHRHEATSRRCCRALAEPRSRRTCSTR